MSIIVRDVYDPEAMLSVVVRAEEPLEQVLRRFAEESWLRGIFVTDDAQRLLGVITRTDMLQWARLRLGTALRDPPLTPDRLLRLSQLVRAATAREAMHPGSEKAAVQPADSLDHALRLMIQMDLIAVPVVDENGRILGDLTLSHLLRYLLEVNKDV